MQKVFKIIGLAMMLACGISAASAGTLKVNGSVVEVSFAQLCKMAYEGQDVNLGGVNVELGVSSKRLVVAGTVLQYTCKSSKVRTGGGSSGHTFVSDLQAQVHEDGSPVIHDNEEEVPVGTTDGGTDVTGIGGHGAYDPSDTSDSSSAADDSNSSGGGNTSGGGGVSDGGDDAPTEGSDDFGPVRG